MQEITLTDEQANRLLKVLSTNSTATNYVDAVVWDAESAEQIAEIADAVRSQVDE